MNSSQGRYGGMAFPPEEGARKDINVRVEHAEKRDTGRWPPARCTG